MQPIDLEQVCCSFSVYFVSTITDFSDFWLNKQLTMVDLLQCLLIHTTFLLEEKMSGFS